MLKKISDLELYEVNYLVAKAQDLTITFFDQEVYVWLDYDSGDIEYSPTTNPSQAWPIIEREKIYFIYGYDCGELQYRALGHRYSSECISYGKTSLEAAMRCYVASVYDEEVEI